MDWIWHNWLPKKVSVCMWKARFKCLAVDERVKSRGIALASRCDCCVSLGIETIDHVLGSREFAQKEIVEDSMEKEMLTPLDCQVLRAMNVSIIKRPVRSPRIVVWEKPHSGWVKLNVDGSCKGNPGNCGGGGIIRDHKGVVQGAFSLLFGHGSNNEAELKAMLE
ncbi:uncharacterized protein LOC121238113 [Juglans microcarpa x Juglans regia]|uniref:uncharacterized protein LOC121238113 n=1 Tax=Juglans microcarpa x Juglans regia TaxID=2249226 RepID=UPI001B7DC647|nr:uncharacterized protein LOC121238113 [Juglans microcarpa x Juglans regia]